MRCRSAKRVLAIAVAGLLFAACAGSDAAVRASGAEPVQLKFHAGDPFPDQVDVALPDAGPIEWHACSDQPEPWQCGELAVPLDYHRPRLETITVALTRRPATDISRRIGSLVVNPGGPGGSGIDLAHTITSTLPAQLSERFDLVGFDPRGVGQSSPLQCDLGAVSRGGYDPRALRRCIADNQALLPQMGTVNAARDLEQIRKAIGDDTLTYLGYSYGTALGSVYATLFPDRVRAIVLDGSVNPGAGSVNVEPRRDLPDFYGVQYFDRSNRRFVAECSIASTCALGAHPGASLDALERSLDAGDVPAPQLPDGDPLTADTLRADLYAAYYNSDYWPYIAEGIAEANAGDGSVLVAIADKIKERQTEETQSQESFANIAVTCADFAHRSGECAGWPLTAEPLPPLQTLVRNAAILVLGTDGDPATPVEQAKVMAKALGNAVTVYWAGDGHTAFLRGSTCIDSLVSSYLVDLTVPKDGLRCPESDTAASGQASADQLFSMSSPRRQQAYVKRAIDAGDTAEHATCMASLFAATLSPSQLTHVFLGVADVSIRLTLRLSLSTCTTA